MEIGFHCVQVILRAADPAASGHGGPMTYVAFFVGVVLGWFLAYATDRFVEWYISR